MSKNIVLISFMFSCLLFAACNKQQKLADEINKQLDTLNYSVGATNIDANQSARLISHINDFVRLYPQDTLSAKYLLEESIAYQKLGKYKQAVHALEKLEKDYPDAKNLSTAIFMEGFIYNNQLHDLAKAKEKYELYLQKYSGINEKITKDVQAELDNLGKSPDEWFKEMKEKNSQM